MPRFAEGTEVPAERSRGEIEKTLSRYGADGFMYGWEGERAMVTFRMKGRMIRFEIPLPSREDEEFKFTPARRHRRSDDEAYRAWEQATRQRWRALALVIKAKLESIDAKIATFEEEFLSHIVMPDGRTAGQWAIPQIAAAYETGKMPAGLLPGVQQ